MSSILDFLRRAGEFALNLLGGWDGTLKLLIAMMALDYASGIVVACLGRSPVGRNGCLDSRAGLSVLLKKGLILMVLAVAAQVDATMEGAFVRAATAWFYIANEALSALENAALAGVPMPEKLRHMLGVMKKAEEAPGGFTGDAH